MSDLDLDALKRYMAESFRPALGEDTVRALIQRLRYWESGQVHKNNAAMYAELETAKARIAQLERVRELVGEIETWEPVQKEMRAALAAMEEPPRKSLV